MTKAGLGADPQDVVWNELFHGNLDAKPKEKFVPPRPNGPRILTKLQYSLMLSIIARYDTLNSFYR